MLPHPWITHMQQVGLYRDCCKYHREKFTRRRKSAGMNGCSFWKRYECTHSPYKISQTSDCLTPVYGKQLLCLWKDCGQPQIRHLPSAFFSRSPTLCLLALKYPLLRGSLYTRSKACQFVISLLGNRSLYNHCTTLKFVAPYVRWISANSAFVKRCILYEIKVANDTYPHCRLGSTVIHCALYHLHAAFPKRIALRILLHELHYKSHNDMNIRLGPRGWGV